MIKINKSLKVVQKNLKQKSQYIDEKKELKDKIGIMPVISFDECDARIDAVSEWHDVLDDEDRECGFSGDS